MLFVALCIWLLTTSRKRAEAERERMEAELRLSQRLEAVGHLAAGVAHEINTPMQFVGDSVRFVSSAFDELRGLGEEYKAICADLAEGRDDEPAIRARIQEAEERADLEYLDERVPAAFERTMDGVARVTAIVAAIDEASEQIDQHDGMRVTVRINAEDDLDEEAWHLRHRDSSPTLGWVAQPSGRNKSQTVPDDTGSHNPE